jgi:hypothetical protein
MSKLIKPEHSTTPGFHSSISKHVEQNCTQKHTAAAATINHTSSMPAYPLRDQPGPDQIAALDTSTKHAHK